MTRLRQHNGFLKAGAKATRTGRPWYPILIVRGFPNKVLAMCFEWMAKKSRKGLGLKCAVQAFVSCLNRERWTNKCPQAKTIPLQMVWLEYENSETYGSLINLPGYVEEYYAI